MKRITVIFIVLASFSPIFCQVSKSDSIISALKAENAALKKSLETQKKVATDQKGRLEAQYGVMPKDVRGAKRAFTVKQMALVTKKMENQPVVADSIEGYLCLLVNQSRNQSREVSVSGPENQKMVIGPRSIQAFYLIPGRYIMSSSSKHGDSGNWYSDRYEYGENQFLVGLVKKTINVNDYTKLAGFEDLDSNVKDGVLLKCHAYIIF